MQFNIIFKTIFEYNHKKIRFVLTNTFCKCRKKLRASPRVHLVKLLYQDLISLLSRCSGGIKIQRESYNVLCYAEDFIIASLSVTGLQEIINAATC